MCTVSLRKSGHFLQKSKNFVFTKIHVHEIYTYIHGHHPVKNMKGSMIFIKGIQKNSDNSHKRTQQVTSGVGEFCLIIMTNKSRNLVLLSPLMEDTGIYHSLLHRRRLRMSGGSQCQLCSTSQ
jgi:ABC-type dipeptide/oligopeptide/nickel transport system ATPase subunit